MKNLFYTLGANEKEMQTFLKILELGAQPVSIIAKHLQTPRSSMYVTLEKLKKLNLIEEFERMGITYIKCIPIDSITDLLKVKERQVEQSINILQEKMPELKALENRLSIFPTVRFFQGKKSVMAIYEEILKEKEFYATFSPHIVKKIMPEYVHKLAEELLKKKGSAKEILVCSKEAEEYKEKFHSQKHQIKILPKGRTFESDNIITKEKIYLISYGENQISGTEIHNKSLAKTHRVLFEELWERL